MNHYIQSNGSGLLNPGAAYQHIHDMAAKRVSTLDYLRKTYVPGTVGVNKAMLTPRR